MGDCELSVRSSSRRRMKKKRQTATAVCATQMLAVPHQHTGYLPLRKSSPLCGRVTAGRVASLGAMQALQPRAQPPRLGSEAAACVSTSAPQKKPPLW